MLVICHGALRLTLPGLVNCTKGLTLITSATVPTLHCGLRLNAIGWCRQSTRSRLKLIPRVANVEQWAKDAPLSTAEFKLLRNYNDKPVLTRPQHRFYFGPNYMEIDLDIHAWAYLARKAFSSYIPRLGTVVFENAFVVQVSCLP